MQPFDKPRRSFLPLLLASLLPGCAAAHPGILMHDEVDLRRAKIFVIDDARYEMDIEGNQVWTETSSEIRMAQLQIVLGQNAKIPPIVRICRTHSPETPYALQIGSEIVFAHPPGWHHFIEN